MSPELHTKSPSEPTPPLQAAETPTAAAAAAAAAEHDSSEMPAGIPIAIKLEQIERLATVDSSNTGNGSKTSSWPPWALEAVPAPSVTPTPTQMQTLSQTQTHNFEAAPAGSAPSRETAAVGQEGVDRHGGRDPAVAARERAERDKSESERKSEKQPASTLARAHTHSHTHTPTPTLTLPSPEARRKAEVTF